MTPYEANHYFETLPEGFAPAEELRAALPAAVQQVQFVGVAGTAGKTATAGLLGAILQAAGFITGLYHAGCEPLAARIRVQGAPVDEVLFREAAEKLSAAKPLPRAAAELAAAAICFGAAGCKLAVVDETGKVLDTGVAHITLGKGASLEKGKDTIRKMLRQHHVTAVAIGNGTASRESEAVVAELLKELPYSVAYMVVSEAGASVYSASKLAAEEFPEYDVSLRSAVSIARRLQDPLAELVKIDPQAIGVGQYQHDMPKAELSAALDGVVEDCVNHVGVDLNTASFSLLSHIAGINQTIAKNIVAYRTENGAFTDRKQLKKVAKLGPKAYEQCAGFLRVPGAKNPLDNTAVHPESYGAAEQILRECGFQLADIAGQDRSEITSIAKQHGIAAIAKKAGVGEPTVKDIIKELAKPGRDPRDELPPPLLRSGDIMELKDLKPGMELVGTVRNVIDFGCFVDIGVHEDGLVHISQICDRFIKHPLEAVKVGEVVKVWVLDVDLKRKRIALTMKPPKKG